MKKCLLLASLLAISLVCHADYNEGAVAYQQGDYQTAFKQWKAVAEQKPTLSPNFEWKLGRTQDSTEAQYGLALLYWQGKGITQNYHEAEKWLSLAANSGHGDAQLKLAFLYLTGLDGKKNPDAARKWFEKSAQQGNVDAQYNLGLLYINGQGVAKDLAVAKKWLSLAAQQGDAAAKTLLTELGAPKPEKTPDKPTEPQLVVAPYPTQDAPAEKPVPVIPVPEPDKAATSPLTESITSVQSIEKTTVAIPSPTPTDAPVQNAPVAENEQYYAIQLMSSPKQHDTQAFIEQWQSRLNPLLATDKLKKSERIFIIAYGHYSSPNEAKQAIASLPDELKKSHPWVIKMRGTAFVP
jgi:septal ring-binding cell division protein DamX